MEGWIKLYKKTLKNPVIMKDSDHLTLWCYILTNAVFTQTDVIFNGKRTTLSPGQFTTGRKKMAYDCGIHQSKVERILKTFKIEQQIEQRTDRQCRLITVLNWSKYQESEQRIEQRSNNDRTTIEQRSNTKEEVKELKELKEKKEERGTPAQNMREFIKSVREEDPVFLSLLESLGGSPDAREELKKFVDYWTERSLSGGRERWETEKTFEVRRRLARWFGNIKKFAGRGNWQDEPRSVAI